MQSRPRHRFTCNLRSAEARLIRATEPGAPKSQIASCHAALRERPRPRRSPGACLSGSHQVEPPTAHSPHACGFSGSEVQTRPMMELPPCTPNVGTSCGAPRAEAPRGASCSPTPGRRSLVAKTRAGTRRLPQQMRRGGMLHARGATGACGWRLEPVGPRRSPSGLVRLVVGPHLGTRKADSPVSRGTHCTPPLNADPGQEARSAAPAPRPRAAADRA